MSGLAERHFQRRQRTGTRDRKRRQQTGARGDGRTRVDVVALAAGQRLVRMVPCACRRNGRADQENHDRRPGSQAARRFMALREGWRHSRRSENEAGVRPAFQSLAKQGRGWRSPQKPEGPSGRRCEDWTRRKELLPRMLGSWSGIIRSHRIRGWQGVRPVCQIGVHRDQQLVVDLRALIRGFRTPALCRTVVGVLGPGFESLPRRKPRVGRDAVWSCAAYGDFRLADGSRLSPRGLVACNLGGGTNDGRRVWSRVCAGLAWARRSEEDWRLREDIGFLLRRAVRGEEKPCGEAGSAVMIMRCRS